MVPLALLATFVALCASANLHSSATYDETGHLPCGFTYLTRADYRMGPEHPPLVRALAALPLAWIGPVVSPEAERAYAASVERYNAVWIFADRLLYRDNDPATLLVPARLVITLLGAVLGVIVYGFARMLFGAAGAAVALALFCLDPSFIAHASLVTTDVGSVLFFTLALFLAWRCCQRLTPARVVGCGLAVGAALASKLSAVLLPPTIALAMLVYRLPRRPWRVGRRAQIEARWRQLVVLGGVLLAIGVVAWGGLWGAYRFRYRATAEAGPTLPLAELSDRIALAKAQRRAVERGADPEALPAAAVAEDARVAGPGASVDVLRWLSAHRVFPEAYVYGIGIAQAYGQLRSSYLLGELSPIGRRSYFPIAFLVKTPLPTLVLFAAGIACALAGGPRRRRMALFLLTPVVFYGAIAVSANLNIGHRHLLPIYPPLFVLAGAAGDVLWRRGALGRAAVAGALLVLALGTLRVHPHFLTYFNAIAGGPANGHRWLLDSNSDWGQALPDLKAWMTANGVARINLCYFGTAEPAAYGIDAVPLPGSVYQELPGLGTIGHPASLPVLPGWVAISATNLYGLYQPAALRRFYAFLRDKEPVARPGNAIFVYRVEEWGR